MTPSLQLKFRHSLALLPLLVLSAVCSSCGQESTNDLTMNDVLNRMEARSQSKIDDQKKQEESARLAEESKWEPFWDGSMLPLEIKKLAKTSSAWLAMVDKGCKPEDVILLQFPKNWNVNWTSFPNKPVKISEEKNGVHYLTDKDEELVLTTKIFEVNNRGYRVKAVFSGKGAVRINYYMSGGGNPAFGATEAFQIFEQNQKVDFMLKNEKDFTKYYLAFRTKGDVVCSHFEIMQTKEPITPVNAPAK